MPMKMKDSPGDNAGIAELLTDDGVSKEVISGFLTALEISGAKMSSGPARDLCATILDEILDFFLFGREVEEAIKVIVCGPITSLKPSQAPSDMPSIGGCQSNGDCDIGEHCGNDRKCTNCKCFKEGGTRGTCDSESDCFAPGFACRDDIGNTCPNMN